MHPVRIAALLLAVLAIHIAADGAVPFLLGWKVKLGTVPFLLSGALILVVIALSVAPARARTFGFAIACCGIFFAAASIIIPLALDGDFSPNSYPYFGGRLFGLIQLCGFFACAALLRRRIASNKLLHVTCETHAREQ